jgi:hypothetical protein
MAPVTPTSVTTPITPSDCTLANTLLADILPIPDWTADAIDSETIPEEVNPAAVNPAIKKNKQVRKKRTDIISSNPHSKNKESLLTGTYGNCGTRANRNNTINTKGRD